MSRRLRKAFTLIELLVVVAIIALLISILMPSLAKAKRQARRVVCGSNLHQIGLAMIQYTKENDDWYPSNGRPNDGNWDVTDADGWPIYYNMVWQYGGNTGAGWANRPAEKRVMYKYVYPEFFQCPDDCPPIYGEDHQFETSYEGTGTSYPLNGYNWATFATVFPKSYGRLGLLDRKSAQVTNPRCVMVGEVVMDEFFGDYDNWPGNPAPRGSGYRWHDKNKPMANLVFVDGSVDYVLINPTERRVQIPSHYWWEGAGYTYSFCPTAPSKRYEQPWYTRSGH